MNYNKIYQNLILKAKNRKLEEYVESHHIVPKCIGGTDEPSNLVELTPEEHYLAHQLLVKIYPDNTSLLYAAMMMIPNRPSNKLYGWLRRNYACAKAKEQSGEGNSQFGTMWISNGIEQKKVKKTDIIPDGWINTNLTGFKNIKSKQLETERKINKKIDYLRNLHEIYKIHGFDEIKKLGYDKSQVNLVQQFNKYLPEFEPQNGKKRKI